MKKFLQWTGFVVAGLVVVAVVGCVWIYFASEAEFDHRFTLAAPQVPAIPADAASIAEGERLARMRGCMHCHGENLAGAVPLDIPNLVRFVAPNVTTAVPQYSDPDLVNLIRGGVRRDGTSTWFMPASMFAHMNDEDLGRILAYVRAVPARGGISGATEMRPLGRMIVAKGDFKSSAREVAELNESQIPVDPADPVGRGRYLVMNLCSECHGQDLNGDALAQSPPLAVAKTYTDKQFARLMLEGVALGDRKLPLMGETARARFSPLSADEVRAMYTYLRSRDAG
ncbi:MAG: c-type cytochrome [Pseudomonadota bacterium]